MVVRGDIEFENGRHEIFPDMGYSFCNCRNIFYTTYVEYENPIDQLRTVFDTMPKNKEAEFFLPDPFFINWNNIYDFVHWKLRQILVIWDIDSFCDVAKEIGFQVLDIERQFNKNHYQTTIVVLGKPEQELRQSVQAARTLFKDRKVSIAEIGVRKGDNAAFMLKQWPFIDRIYLIDAWKPYEAFPSEIAQNHTRDTVIDRFSGNEKVHIIVNDSVEGARELEDNSLDFVYIDGDHSYEGVTRDLRAWIPKVKKGGILGGHDYDFEHDQVKRAVHKFFNGAVHHGENSNGLQDWWVYL